MYWDHFEFRVWGVWLQCLEFLGFSASGSCFAIENPATGLAADSAPDCNVGQGLQNSEPMKPELACSRTLKV